MSGRVRLGGYCSPVTAVDGGEYCVRCDGTLAPPIVELGDAIEDADRFMTVETWMEWATRVAAEVEERGAWFLLGSRPDGDVLVVDVLTEWGREPGPTSLIEVLHRKLRYRNVRHVRFFRWTGPC